MNARSAPDRAPGGTVTPCDVQALAALLRNNAPLMDALALCRDAMPEGACIGAGAIRNTVWDCLHGRAPGLANDVDVVFFDARLGREADADLARLLRAARPGLDWDVVNQAHVHEWYRDAAGREVAPLASLLQGVATWPETATAVAVRLDHDGSLRVLAPCGLDDLLGMLLRWNPVRASHAAFMARVRSKCWLERWPRLRLVD